MRVKIKRGIWLLVRAVLFRPTPKRLGNGWRVAILRMFGAKIGKGTLVLPTVKVLIPWNLELGDGAVIGADADIYNFAKITIEANAMVSQRTFLCTGSHDHTHPHLPLTYAPITVKSEAWVAAECFVSPGVTIGSGAVIAARSVVTKDMPEWMICGGHPCKPLKPRVMQGEEGVEKVRSRALLRPQIRAE